MQFFVCEMSKSKPYPESKMIQLCRRPVAPEVVARARFTLLDWLGCVFAARNSDVAYAMAHAHRVSDRDIVRAGLSSTQYDAQSAALLLGTLGNVLEMDDLHRASILHPGDTVHVNGYPCEVIDTSDPALVTLRTPNGATFKIGRVELSKSST